MKNKLAFAVGLLLAAGLANEVMAQPNPIELPISVPPQKGKEKGKQPDPKKEIPPKLPVEVPNLDAEPIAQRSNLSTGYTPNMMGDLWGYFARFSVPVPGTVSSLTVFTPNGNRPPGPVPPPGQQPVPPPIRTGPTAITANRTLLIPGVSHGAFKVAENASPMPVDRVYVTYNYFGDIRSNLNGPTGPTTTTTTTPFAGPLFGGATTTTTTLAGAPYVNLHREVFGIEKTFLDGRASVEVRLPVFQQPNSLNGFRAGNIADVTVIGKYAFLLDRAAGNVVSGGLAITAPTGPGIATLDGTIRDTLIQPWGGYIFNYNNLFVQGFHSVVIPTDQRDITLLFNDVGLGYRVYQGQPGQPVRFVAPAAEVHVTTPLNHRGEFDTIYAPDLIVMTGGLHVGFFSRATLSIGVATPISGPRIYGVETFAQFNVRY